MGPAESWNFSVSLTCCCSRMDPQLPPHLSPAQHGQRSRLLLLTGRIQLLIVPCRSTRDFRNTLHVLNLKITKIPRRKERPRLPSFLQDGEAQGFADLTRSLSDAALVPAPAATGLHAALVQTALPRSPATRWDLGWEGRGSSQPPCPHAWDSSAAHHMGMA